MTKIIGLNGYAKSGKDTAGGIIQRLLQHPDDSAMGFPTWEIKKFGGKLKQIASLLTGIPVEDFEKQEVKDSNLPSQWNYFNDEDFIPRNMSVRHLLQVLGTEGLREGLHKDVWVNALFADYVANRQARTNDLVTESINGNGMITWKFNPALDLDGMLYPNWIITDVRYPNEATAIDNRGGLVIRINRPGIGPANNHMSENSLDSYKFDYTIENSGDIQQLEAKIESILKIERLLK